MFHWRQVETLAKRLTTLSQLIAVLATISIAGALRHRETWQLRDDAIAMVALQSIAAFNVESSTKDAHTFEALWSWMADNDKALDAKRYEVRRSLTAWLQSMFGTDQLKVGGLSGKGHHGASGTPFFVEEMVSPEGAPADGLSPSTVASVLDVLRQWRHPLRVRVLAAWPPAIPIPSEGSDKEVVVGSIRVVGNSLEISFSGFVAPIQQELPSPWMIPIETVELARAPALWVLVPPPAEFREVLLRLDADAVRRERLLRKYGPLPLTSANAIIQQELGVAYKSVDLFGIDVSTQDAASAIWLLLLAINIALMLTIREATGKAGTFGGLMLESVFSLVLGSNGARLFVWAIVPAFTVCLAAVGEPRRGTGFAVLLGQALAVMAIGAVAWWQSRPLYQKREFSRNS